MKYLKILTVITTPIPEKLDVLWNAIKSRVQSTKTAVCDRCCLDWSYILLETGVDCRQASLAYTICDYHAVVAHAEWDLHCLDLITMDFTWNTSSWWQYMSLYNPQKMPPMLFSLMQPHLHLSLMKVCMVPLVLGTEKSTSNNPEISWNVDSSEHSTHFHVYKMSSGPDNPAVLLHRISFLLE